MHICFHVLFWRFVWMFCMYIICKYTYVFLYICIFVCVYIYLFYVYVYLHVCIPGIHPSNFVVRLTAQKLNLITFDFKAFWHRNSVQKYVCLLGFFCLKLFICPSDVKKAKSFRSFTPWTPTKAPLSIHWRAYSTLRPLPAFYNIRKLNLCSKNGH